MKTRVWTMTAALAACVPQAATTATESATGTEATGTASEATADAPTTTDGTTGAPAQCETFPTYRIDVQAEPNGLYYRVDEQKLYIADDDNNRVLVRDEDGTTEVFAEIPNPPAIPAPTASATSTSPPTARSTCRASASGCPGWGRSSASGPTGLQRRSRASTTSGAASASTTTTRGGCSTWPPTRATPTTCTPAGSPASTRSPASRR
ncbi:hypothetical protein [Nannocystis pusilla]|uniref:hypothetical protein n=1 Tax=Nannocystis pusilla TaxID=889268 RepID=UPI003B7B08EE